MIGGQAAWNGLASQVSAHQGEKAPVLWNQRIRVREDPVCERVCVCVCVCVCQIINGWIDR